MAKILIVDDDSSLLEMMETLLKTEGYDVVLCADGGEALSLARNATPDLILMDVYIEGHNGYDICLQMKANRHTKHIPILIISASKMSKELISLCNANGYLPKPFDIAVFLASVKKHLVKAPAAHS